jgi:ribosomal protein S18 acetylase RimI-like enzyme
MTLSLRAAAASDIEAIALVWYRGWFDGHLGHVPETLLPYRRLADFRRRVPPRIERTTVAILDARVAGFLTVHEDEIEQVYVAEKARGGGVADALLEHGERAIAGRFDAAWLAVVAGNTRACRFYMRHGWQDAGSIEYPAEAGGGHIAVTARRYEKRLSPTTPDLSCYNAAP